MTRRHLNGVAAAAIAAVLVAACGIAGAESEQLQVVAITTQVGAAAAEIGGDAIELTVLLQPGVEAHDFELTAAAAGALERADLILKSGAGLEGWLDDALVTIGGRDRVRDMSAGVELREPAAESHAEGEADEHAEEHGDVDPHYWLSAPNAVRLVENVRDALVSPDAADAADADGLRQRAEAAIGRLHAADSEIRRLMDEIPADQRGVVTNHDALGYFIAEYELRFVGSIFPSLDVSAEPNPGELAELVETIRREDVGAIFSESAVNRSLAEAIAEETGARVVDDPLYTDSMGPAGSGADTLDGMLLHNATVIHDGLTGD